MNQPEIQITGIGLSCVSGEKPFAMFGAVASNMSFSKPDPYIQVPSVNDESFEYVMSCPMEQLTGCEDPNQRMLLNTIIALTRALESLNYYETIDDEDIAEPDILVYIVLPNLIDGRGEDLDLTEWRETLLGEDSPLIDYIDVDLIDIKFGNYTEGTTQQLSQVCKVLQKGEQWDTIIFGGVDSLLDELTSFELNKEQRIQTEKTQGGIIIGEGAAFLVLKSVNNELQNNQPAPLAYIKSLSQKEEPYAGKKAIVKYTGQRNAINDVLIQSNIALDKINTMVVSPGLERHSLLEYHQMINKLYPNKLPEQQRMAYQLGEIKDAPALKPRELPEKLDLSFTYGFVGAASIPMSIVLACARFEFKYPSITNCIVCESNEYAHRGAILLSQEI